MSNITAFSVKLYRKPQHHMLTFANIFEETPTELTNAYLELQSLFLGILSQCKSKDTWELFL